MKSQSRLLRLHMLREEPELGQRCQTAAAPTLRLSRRFLLQRVLVCPDDEILVVGKRQRTLICRFLPLSSHESTGRAVQLAHWAYQDRPLISLQPVLALEAHCPARSSETESNVTNHRVQRWLEWHAIRSNQVGTDSAS